MNYADYLMDANKEKNQMMVYLANMMENHKQNMKGKRRNKKMTKKEEYNVLNKIMKQAISDDGTSYRAMFAAGIGTKPRTDYDHITTHDCHFWLEIDGKVFDPTPNPSPYEMDYKPFPIKTQCRLAASAAHRVKEKEANGELEDFYLIPKQRSCWYNVYAWKKFHPDAKKLKARIVIGSAGFKLNGGTYWEYG